VPGTGYYLTWEIFASERLFLREPRRELWGALVGVGSGRTRVCRPRPLPRRALHAAGPVAGGAHSSARTVYTLPLGMAFQAHGGPECVPK
jgi:hypothetical protein